MSDFVPRVYDKIEVVETSPGRQGVHVRRLGEPKGHTYGDYDRKTDDAACVRDFMKKRLGDTGWSVEIGDEVARAHAEADDFCRSRPWLDRAHP